MLPCCHKLRKIFNRNTHPSVQQIIKGHYQTILRNSAQPTQDQAETACNCRKKDECPLEGNCLSKGIVYQAQVTSASKTETYIGLTATEFKARFRNHQVSFNNETHKNDTELSKHIWQLKNKEQHFKILNGRSSQRRNLILTWQSDVIYARRRSISSSPNPN